MAVARVGALKIPQLGLGTWKAAPGEVGAAVTAAIGAGYRLIDCAAAYGNEAEVGAALRGAIDGGVVTRDELFVVGKCFQTHHVWRGDSGRPREALLQTLEDLQLESLDLYLMHWPFAFEQKDALDAAKWGPFRDAVGTPNPALTIELEYVDTWRCLQALAADGLTDAVGVSNCTAAQLAEMAAGGLPGGAPLAVNQVEFHPYLQQPELRSYCAAQGITMMGYSPLGSGDSYSGASYPADMGCTLLANPAVLEVARRHGKSAAQVLVRFSLQSGLVCIPKSSRPARIEENFDVLDFELTPRDLELLTILDRGFRYGIGYAPGHYDCANAPWTQQAAAEEAAGSGSGSHAQTE